MAGFNAIESDVHGSVMYADNASFDGTARGGIMVNNGELWIGSDSAPFVRKNTLTAGAGISITNAAGSITIANTGSLTDLHVARYIVSAGGIADGANYTTIASAYADAVAAGGFQTVFVQPGTYTEDLTLTNNVYIVGLGNNGTTFGSSVNTNIIGKLTLTSGNVNIFNLGLQTNSDNLANVSGGSRLNLLNCFLYSPTANAAINMSAGIVTLMNCFYSDGGPATGPLVTGTSGGTLKIYNSILFGTSNTPSTLSGTGILLLNSSITTAITQTGISSFFAQNSQLGSTTLNANLSIGGTGTKTITNCYLGNATGATITVGSGTTLSLDNCVIDNSTATAAIDGAGTLNYANLNFAGTQSNITTTIQIPNIGSNDAVKVVSPGAYPYTTVPQDNVILVDTSSARTITPLASPTTGQIHRIKDSVGSAGTNNITVTPSGKNIDGAASYTINTNYGSIDIVYNGTQWNVL